MSIRSLVFGLVGCMVSIGAQAGQSPWAVDVNASTLGGGVEVYRQLSDQFVLRGGPRYLTFDRNETIDDVRYDGELQLFNMGLIADWHPFETGFRISAGAFAGDNSIDLTAEPQGNLEIGNTTYTAAQLGTIDGDIELNTLAPYVGVGFSNAFTETGNWSISIDVGVKFSGSPDVTLNANGPAAQNALFQQNLRDEERSIEDDLEWLQFYPMVGVGVSYRF